MKRIFTICRMQLLAFLLLVILPIVVCAKTYDVEATGEYVMGDSDTKLEARRIALEHAKRLAAEQIGTYLESETIVRDNRLEKDEIRSYTSAILKTTVLSEGVNLLSDKTTVFTIKIKANVDTSVLEKKIKEIKADTKRKDQLDRLQAENVRLLKELETISAQLRSGKTGEYKNLREQRESLFERLEKNYNSIKITFEKGTLFSLALQNKDEMSELKKTIEESFRFFADNITFRLDDPKIMNKGDVADIILRWTWKLNDVDKFLSMLDTYCSKPYVSGNHFNMVEGLFKTVNAKELFSYSGKFSIALEVKVGPRTQKMSIHSANNGFWAYPIYLSGGKDWPIIFKDVPISDLENITNIDAKIILYNEN